MAHPNKIRCASAYDIIRLYLLQQKCIYLPFIGTVKPLWLWYLCGYLFLCRFTSSWSSCSSWCVSMLLLCTSLYTKICHCVERPCWQVTMPLAEGGPHRTSNPSGTEPRIALPWGSLDPIMRNTNTLRQLPNNSLATCQKFDITSDLIADKQNLLCFVIDMALHWLKQRKWHVYKPTWSSSIKSEEEKVVLTSWKDFFDSAELILIVT